MGISAECHALHTGLPESCVKGPEHHEFILQVRLAKQLQSHSQATHRKKPGGTKTCSGLLLGAALRCKAQHIWARGGRAQITKALSVPTIAVQRLQQVNRRHMLLLGQA